jgi:ribosomal protein S18 acetylase RimI-like enzyme
MAAYREEARLLGVENFPPLRRTVEDLGRSSSIWFGLSLDGTLAAVLEIEEHPARLHIASLIVHPDFVRRGLATRLLRYLLDVEFPGQAFSVATGAANTPAIRLYEKLGFQIQQRWKTGEGIAMVTLQCRAPGEPLVAWLDARRGTL